MRHFYISELVRYCRDVKLCMRGAAINCEIRPEITGIFVVHMTKTGRDFDSDKELILPA